MVTWRLLFPNGSVNLLYMRKLATMKNTTMKIMNTIGKDILPPKPKRPASSYLLYLHSVRNKLQQECPDIKYKELVKKISQEWVKVDSTIKQEFQKQHDDEYALYKQKLDDYNHLVLTEEQKMLLAKKLVKDSTLRENQELREQILKKFGKPKRPLTSYNLFVQNKKYSKDVKMSHKEWMKNISNEWNNMTIQDKDKYNTISKQLREKYSIELTKWKENMIQTGHADLLKSNTEFKRDSGINFSDTKIQNKDTFKTDWGTDTINSTADIPHGNNVLEQQHESTRSYIFYNDRNDLQALMKYSRNEMKDVLINNSKTVQTRTYIWIYNYFASVWKRFLLVLKKVCNKNWQMNN